MAQWSVNPSKTVTAPALAAIALSACWTVAGQARLQQKSEVLKIGACASIAAEENDKKKEDAAIQTLQELVKQEAMTDNEIISVKDWSELAKKMSTGEYQIGVFLGHEFAWAQQKYPKLHPLAIAINTRPYAVAALVVHKEKGPADVAGLKGQPLALPAFGQTYPRMFADQLSQSNGGAPDKFFSKMAAQANVEDALDDVVDGKMPAAVVDQTTLDAFKRRKPGRFNQLKELAHSQPLPPIVIAYYDDILPATTRDRFKMQILASNQLEKAQMVLTMFRLTGFQPVPDDFDQVLAETRKNFPAPTIPKGG